MSAQRFRKRPIVVEAMQYDGANDDAVVRWVGGDPGGDGLRPAYAAVGGVVIYTLEGEMLAKPGDWIIKGVAGEFYPIKDSILRETYEPAP